MTVAEIYVSTDVEADGPIPGPYSMLSFGSAAYRADKTLVGTFCANLITLPGAGSDPQTMEWWRTQPEAWEECRRDQEQPADVMPRYVAWLQGLPGAGRLRFRAAERAELPAGPAAAAAGAAVCGRARHRRQQAAHALHQVGGDQPTGAEAAAGARVRCKPEPLSQPYG